MIIPNNDVSLLHNISLLNQDNQQAALYIHKFINVFVANQVVK